MRLIVPFTLLCALLLFGSGCARVGGEVFQPTVTDALVLGDGQVIGQSFRPANAHVRGVDLLVATYGVRPVGGTLQVTVSDAVNGALLWQSEVPGAELADNTWVQVAAPAGSAAQAPEIAAVELRWLGPGRVGLWANVPTVDRAADVPLNDPYPGGELLLDGQAAPGDLAIRVRGDGSALRSAAALLRAGGSRVIDAPMFLLMWLLVLGGAVALAVTSFSRSRRSVQLGQRRPDQQQSRDQEAGAQEAEQPLG